MGRITSGKAFGAIKSAVLRIAKRGYAPDCAMLTVKDADRDRLREYSARRGATISDGLTILLDEAGMPRAEERRRAGKLHSLVERMMRRSGARTGDELYSLLRSGHLDDILIEEYTKI